jgi:hypothetical protein
MQTLSGCLHIGSSSEERQMAPALLKAGSTMLSLSFFVLFTGAILGATYWAIKEEADA